MAKIIAIVDDEAEMEFIYKMLFEDAIKSKQIDLKFFSDSRLFDLWLRYNQPDLVLSDINMPHLSGLELGRRIREKGKSILTYFVSGDEEKDYQTTMRELGVNRYIPKPVNFNKIMEFIKTDLSLQG